MRRSGGIVAAGLIVVSCLVPSAGAESYKPTRFDDPKPGKCKPNDCSLREATIAVNNKGRKATIRLRKGTYKLERPSQSGDGAGESGPLYLEAPATVSGQGAKKTTVDAKGKSGVFFLTNQKKKLKNLTVTGGSSSAGSGVFADYKLRQLILNRVKITGNESDVTGGGLLVVSENVQLIDSTVSENSAGTGGGGIAIGNNPDSDVGLNVRSSAIFGNSAGTVGGGISVTNADASLTKIENSTVTNNSAVTFGGGIYLDSGTLLANHLSVGFNLADSDSASGGSGGGVSRSGGGLFQLENSVLVDNAVGATGSDPQCNGAFLGGGNVITSPAGCTSFDGGSSNLITTATIASPPDANGGPTKTMALPASSPALGFNLGCPKVDQRGVKRSSPCDAGAYERK